MLNARLKEIARRYAVPALSMGLAMVTGCEYKEKIMNPSSSKGLALDHSFRCGRDKIDLIVALKDSETRPVDIKVKNITQGETTVVTSKDANQRGILMWASKEGQFPGNKLRLNDGDQIVVSVVDPRSSKSKPIKQTDTFVKCD